MSLFDYVINLVESILICYFIYRYFSLKSIPKLVGCIFLIFIEITAGNLFMNDSWIYIVLMGLTLVIYQWLIYRLKITIETIVISISILLIDMICGMFALLLLPIFGKSLNTRSVLIIITLLSKLFFFIAVMYFSNQRLEFKSELDTKRWNKIVIIFSLLLLELFILANDYVIGNINSKDILICMVLTSLIIVFIFNIYTNILKENEEKMYLLLKNEEIKYKKENYNVLTKMVDDIYRLEHNLRYILMKIKFEIQDKKYDECLELIENYTKNFNKFKTIINTENPYFDYFINKKLNELYMNNIDANISISISKSDYYLNKEYTNYVLLLLDSIKSKTDKLTINIYEINNNNIIEIMIKDIDKETLLNKEIKGFIDKLKVEYKITTEDNILIFKSIQEMNI